MKYRQNISKDKFPNFEVWLKYLYILMVFLYQLPN